MQTETYFCKKFPLKKKLFLPALFLLMIASCTTLDIYEKNAVIPGHEWQSSFKPAFTFSIEDTTAPYDVMLILRHTEKYNYNNIWLTVTIQPPGDTARTIRIEKTLATNKDGWLGTAMDDIYEQRMSINKELAENNISFKKQGDYTFTLQQVMREDPLQNVMNAGVRVEKK
jgi:gliding motility-associated lipoprotein GldH